MYTSSLWFVLHFKDNTAHVDFTASPLSTDAMTLHSLLLTHGADEAASDVMLDVNVSRSSSVIAGAAISKVDR